MSPCVSRQVADVVVDRERLDQAERLLAGLDDVIAQREFRDGAGKEHARVAVAHAVELRVQRPGADFHLSADDGVELEDRDAERVVALVVLRVDGGLDLVEVEDRHVRVKLAADDDVAARRVDVRAVRALRLRDQVEEPFVDGRLHRDHRDTVHHRGLAGLDDLGGLLPVDDVQVVEVVLRHAGLHRLAALGVAAGRHLGVV